MKFFLFSFSLYTFFCTFAAALRKGEVLEWLKRHAWKACNRQNRFAGSNPVLSAQNSLVLGRFYSDRFFSFYVLEFIIAPTRFNGQKAVRIINDPTLRDFSIY